MICTKNTKKSPINKNMFFFVPLSTTVCIRIVADFGNRIFQFTTNVDSGYNVHIYYYFGYYFYILLAKVYFNCNA